MDLEETECEVVDWIKLARDQIQWRAFVSTVIFLRCTQKQGGAIPPLPQNVFMAMYLIMKWSRLHGVLL